MKEEKTDHKKEKIFLQLSNIEKAIISIQLNDIEKEITDIINDIFFKVQIIKYKLNEK